ncbi:hypothetical protein D9758_012599 [Tetrapyrgos nigripes]|uniref:Uncharacterized protein n=1 Tax=Tetrapyrgos nigripes TaxID=182062 RepID=A0A8H5LN02_9AGAR|nr:hypothetical protein D9758_012599 [Tetrapyrgos nigripes]
MDSFTPYHTHTQSNDYSTHSGHYLSSSSLPTSSSRHLTIHDLYSHVGDLRSTSHPEYRSELENSPFPSATRVMEPPSHNIYLSPAPAPSSSFSEYEESSRQPPEVCENCDSYRCMADEKTLLTRMKASTDVDFNDIAGGRLLWLWRCLREAVPWKGVFPEDHNKLEEMWRSLLDMDDIWLMWDIGDELRVPKPKTCVPRYVKSFRNSAVSSISRRLKHHFSGQCGLDAAATSSEGAYHQFEIRFALILWKSLFACRRTKFRLRPSSIEREIPSLVSKWWDMLPKSVKDELVYFSDTRPEIWNDFCAMLKRRGHACYEDLPDETMWKVLMTMHHLCAIPWPYLPFHLVNCAGCLKIQSQPSGLNLKPHLIPLFCIPSQMRCYFSYYYEELDYENSAPTSSKFWTDKWIHSNKRGGTKIKLLPNLLSQTSLQEMDKWLSNLPSVNIGRKRTLGSFIPKEDWIPSHWVDLLQDNEDDLSVHWTETEAAVEAATGIAYSRYSPAPFTEEEVAEGSTTGWSSDPASWLCAVALLSIVKSVGFGPQAAGIFTDVLREEEEEDKSSLQLLLEQAPALQKSEATRAFQNSLEKSGHTCWTDLGACGKNSIPDLYASAYYVLIGGSEVPVVGCGQMDPDRDPDMGPQLDSKCRTCRIQDGLHDLSNALDNPKSTFGLSIDAKRMISSMNHDRYQTNRCPLTQKNLREFSQTLIETGNGLQQQAQSICSSDCANDDAHYWEEVENIICRGYMDNDSEDTDSEESSTPPPPNHSGISSQSGSNDVALNGSSTANKLLSFQEDYVEAAPDISLTSRTDLGLIPDQDSDKTTSGNHSIDRREAQSTTKSSKPKNRPSRQEMRDNVKLKLLEMLDSNKIYYGKGLPWKTLQEIVAEQGFEFVNWPESKGEPVQLTRQDGIQKATGPEISPLYDALNDEERPLQIRRKNAAERNPSERAGNKRSRDEQEGDVERDSAAKRARTAEPSNSRN